MINIKRFHYVCSAVFTCCLFVCSERAQLFYMLEEDGLLVWIQEVGLSKYAQGIIRHAPSGTDLVKLVSSHNEHVSGCHIPCVVGWYYLSFLQSTIL